jgi:adenylate kinase family enzyme
MSAASSPGRAAGPLPVLLFGRAGSGKGTVSQLLSAPGGTYGVTAAHCSTGQAMRAWAEGPLPEQRALEAALARGELGTDALAARIVSDFLSSAPAGTDAVLLDGFPRTLAQLDAWTAVRRGADIGMAVVLHVPEDVAIARLSLRAQCEADGWTGKYPGSPCPRCGAPLARRADDADNRSIARRLADFESRAMPIVEAWSAAGLPVIGLDGRLPAAILARDIAAAVRVRRPA